MCQEKRRINRGIARKEPCLYVITHQPLKLTMTNLLNTTSPYRFKTHRRTITETDIVTFVNVVGLHEPFFIDMEYIRKNMEGAHRSRFAPGPMIISLGMGLLATYVPDIIQRALKEQNVGPFGGMTGLQARLRGALFPGDTIHVEGEARLLPKTSRGYTLMELQHLVINQHGETLADFTETLTFMPKESGAS